jgi:deazaflavin-dependent oxidoreductase (nitroreductase family)
MRVEHDGRYLAVASSGGSRRDPDWVHNLRENPHVEVQDGSMRRDYSAREPEGDERETWWTRAVEAFPNYAAYQARTKRLIPVFVLEPRG